MKTKPADLVVNEIDLDNPPPLTLKQKREIAKLERMPESSIDYSDIPSAHEPTTRLYRPLKEQVTARIDADVLAWLKTDGRGYQSRMNAILRREMLASRKGKR